MVRMAERTGKPIVVVLVEGVHASPLEAVESSDATVMALLPGDEGARAIADVLAGTVNPSGKLPFTYPRYPSAHNTYDHRTTDLIDPQFGQNAFNPLFEFGHGLRTPTSRTATCGWLQIPFRWTANWRSA